MPRNRKPYEAWFEDMFGVKAIIPNTTFYSTFAPGTPWGEKLTWAMMDAEILYARHLLERLDADKVEGDLVEFGIYRGGWIHQFCEHFDQSSVKRQVWGFDSFEGLPEVDAERDQTIAWSRGMYAANYDHVKAYLRLDERPYLHLEKGWFSDTLKAGPALSIEKIAYARIDSDLYQSCVDCLEFLDGRLVDGAVLIFDDWLYDHSRGEPLAFAEWMERGARKRYKFTFLELNLFGHLYLRVDYR